MDTIESTILLRADASGLTSTMDQAATSTKTAMTDIESAATSASAGMTKLGASGTAMSASLSDAAAQAATHLGALPQQLASLGAGIDSLKASVGGLSGSMDVMAASAVKATGGLKEAGTATMSASRQFSEGEASARKFGGGLLETTKYVLGYYAVFKAGQIVLDTFTAAHARAFQDALTHVEAFTRPASVSIAAYHDQVKALGAFVLTEAPKLGLNIQASADGLYQLASAGIKAADMQTVLSGGMKLAAASSTDLQTTLSAVIPLYNSFHLQGSQVGAMLNDLAEMTNLSTAEFKDWAPEIGMVTAQANQMKVPIKDMAAVLVTLNNNGLSAAESVTQLNNMLRALDAPGKIAIATATGLGVSWTQLFNVQRDGLIPTLQKISDLLQGGGHDAQWFADHLGVTATQAQTLATHTATAAEMVKNLFGGNSVAMRAFFSTFSDGAATLHQHLTAMQGDSNALSQSLTKALTSPQAHVNQLTSELDKIRIEIEEKILPSFDDFVKKTDTLAQGLDKNLPSIEKAFTPIVTDADNVGKAIAASFQSFTKGFDGTKGAQSAWADMWHNLQGSVESAQKTIGTLEHLQEDLAGNTEHNASRQVSAWQGIGNAVTWLLDLNTKDMNFQMGLFSDLAASAEKGVRGIEEAFQAFGSYMTGTFIPEAQQVNHDVWQKFEDGGTALEKVLSKIGTTASQWGQEFLKGFGNPIDAVVGKINGLIGLLGHIPNPFGGGSGTAYAAGGSTGLFTPTKAGANILLGPANEVGQPYFQGGTPAGHEDFQVGAGTPVVSAALPSGDHYHMEFVGYEAQGGNTIAAQIVNSSGNVVGHFDLMHLESFGSGISTGANVGGGVSLGLSGNTGSHTTGAHLHFGFDTGAQNIFSSEGYNVPGGFSNYNQLIPGSAGRASGIPASLQKYAPYILAAAQKYHVAPSVISDLIMGESSGNPGAVSDMGAVGLTQVLPSTFAAQHVGSSIFNPQQNINAGTKDLSSLIQKYGSVRSALAYGYNPLPGGKPNWQYADYILGQGAGTGAYGGMRPVQMMGGSMPQTVNGQYVGGVHTVDGRPMAPGGSNYYTATHPALMAPFVAPAITGVPDQSIVHAQGYLGDYSSAVSSLTPGLAQYLAGQTQAYQSQITKEQKTYVSQANQYETGTYAPQINAQRDVYAASKQAVQDTYQNAVQTAKDHYAATMATLQGSNQEAIRHYLTSQGIAASSQAESVVDAGKKKIDSLQGSLQSVDAAWATHKSNLEATLSKAEQGSHGVVNRAQVAKDQKALDDAQTAHDRQVSKIQGEITAAGTGVAEKLGINDTKRTAQMNEWLTHHKTVLDTAETKAAQSRDDALRKAETNRENGLTKADAANQKAVDRIDAANQSHLAGLRKTLDTHIAGIDKAMKAATDPGTLWSALTTAISKSAASHQATSDVAFLEGGRNQSAINQLAGDQLAQQRMGLATSQTTMNVDLLTGNLGNLSTDFGNLAGVVQNVVIAGYMKGAGAIDKWMAGLVEAANGQELITQVQTGFKAAVDGARTDLSSMASDVSTLSGITLRQFGDAAAHGGTNLQTLSAKLVQEANASDAITHAQNLQSVVVGALTHSASMLNSGLSGLASTANDAMTFFTDMVGRGQALGTDFATVASKALSMADNLGSFSDVLSGVGTVLAGIANQQSTELLRTGGISAGSTSAYVAAYGQQQGLNAVDLSRQITDQGATGDYVGYYTSLGSAIKIVTDKMNDLALKGDTTSATYQEYAAQVKKLTSISNGLGEYLQANGDQTALNTKLQQDQAAVTQAGTAATQSQTDAVIQDQKNLDDWNSALTSIQTQGVQPAIDALKLFTISLNPDQIKQMQDDSKTASQKADEAVTQLGTDALASASDLGAFDTALTALGTTVGQVMAAMEMELGKASALVNAATNLPTLKGLAGGGSTPPPAGVPGPVYNYGPPGGPNAPGSGAAPPLQSGQAVAEGLGAGLLAGAAKVGVAAQGVLAQLKYWLHFGSPNAAGDDPSIWGANVGKGFTQGLLSTVPTLTRAGSTAVQAMITAMQSGVTAAGTSPTWQSMVAAYTAQTTGRQKDAQGRFVTPNPYSGAYQDNSAVTASGIPYNPYNLPTDPSGHIIGQGAGYAPTLRDPNGIYDPNGLGMNAGNVILGPGGVGYQVIHQPYGSQQFGGKIVPLGPGGVWNLSGILPYRTSEATMLANPGMGGLDNNTLAANAPGQLFENWVRQSMGLPNANFADPNGIQMFSSMGNTAFTRQPPGTSPRMQDLLAQEAAGLVDPATGKAIVATSVNTATIAANTTSLVQSAAAAQATAETTLLWLKQNYAVSKVATSRIGIGTAGWEDWITNLDRAGNGNLASGIV